MAGRLKCINGQNMLAISLLRMYYRCLFVVAFPSRSGLGVLEKLELSAGGFHDFSIFVAFFHSAANLSIGAVRVGVGAGVADERAVPKSCNWVGEVLNSVLISDEYLRLIVLPPAPRELQLN
jgi:hypothetical protein